MSNLHKTKTVKRLSRAALGAAAVAGVACAAMAGAAVPPVAAAGFNYGVISYTDIADTFTRETLINY